jgi:hypothetical protein
MPRLESKPLKISKKVSLPHPATPVNPTTQLSIGFTVAPERGRVKKKNKINKGGSYIKFNFNTILIVSFLFTFL